VKRSHGRDIERPDEVDDVTTVLAAPDPVLVLDRDDVDASVQSVGGPLVVVRLVLANPMVDFDGIRRRRLLRRMKRDDLTIGGVSREVAGEGGNPAVSRWIGGNEGSANDGVSSSWASSGCAPEDSPALPMVHDGARASQDRLGGPDPARWASGPPGGGPWNG
jgi:hypothetical protein